VLPLVGAIEEFGNTIGQLDGRGSEKCRHVERGNSGRSCDHRGTMGGRLDNFRVIARGRTGRSNIFTRVIRVKRK
jgi:hypothetical protein